MKKITKPSLLNMVATLFTFLGLVLYIVNCNSIYFKKFGMDNKIIIFLILALVIEITLIVMTFINKNKILSIINEFMAILIPIFVIVAVAFLLDARIYYSATILTYEKTDQNVKDLIPALVSLGALLVSFIVNIVMIFITPKSPKKD